MPPRPEVESRPLPRLDLYHDRIREVVYRSLPEPRRRALHRSLAVTLEAQDGGRDAEVLVRHWAGAGDRAQQRRYAAEAAEQAAAKLAFARAALLFRLVLDDPDPFEAPLDLAARWERTGDLYEYGGLHLEAARAYAEAQRRWDEAPAHHAGRAAARLRLRGRAGDNLIAAGSLAEGRAALASGLALLGLPLDRKLPERIAVIAALHGRNALAARLGGLPVASRLEPDLAAEVHFFHGMVRAVQTLWPALAAEAAERAELLARRIDDRAVLLRSMVSAAVVPVFLGRCSPAQLDRSHLRLDAADELARAHDVVLGRELVQVHRSLIWLATSAPRARRLCEAALAGFARRGMHESFDGVVARAYYFLVLGIKGDDEDVFAFMSRELALPRHNFINLALVLCWQPALLARRGRIGEAREALARAEAHLAGAPPSRFDLTLARARADVLIAEGRYAEVLAAAPLHEQAARATGAWAVGLDRSGWSFAQLQAALGLLRRGALAGPARRHARAAARWLAGSGVFDFGCLGHRALALLDHAEGRPRAAAAELRRALTLSSANTNPYHRWLCLEAAREIGALTLDQDAEAAELREEGRFAAPVVS